VNAPGCIYVDPGEELNFNVMKTINNIKRLVSNDCGNGYSWIEVEFKDTL